MSGVPPDWMLQPGEVWDLDIAYYVAVRRNLFTNKRDQDGYVVTPAMAQKMLNNGSNVYVPPFHEDKELIYLEADYAKFAPNAESVLPKSDSFKTIYCRIARHGEAMPSRPDPDLPPENKKYDAQRKASMPTGDWYAPWNAGLLASPMMPVKTCRGYFAPAQATPPMVTNTDQQPTFAISTWKGTEYEPTQGSSGSRNRDGKQNRYEYIKDGGGCYQQNQSQYMVPQPHDYSNHGHSWENNDGYVEYAAAPDFNTSRPPPPEQTMPRAHPGVQPQYHNNDAQRRNDFNVMTTDQRRYSQRNAGNNEYHAINQNSSYSVPAPEAPPAYFNPPHVGGNHPNQQFHQNQPQYMIPLSQGYSTNTQYFTNSTGYSQNGIPSVPVSNTSLPPSSKQFPSRSGHNHYTGTDSNQRQIVSNYNARPQDGNLPVKHPEKDIVIKKRPPTAVKNLTTLTLVPTPLSIPDSAPGKKSVGPNTYNKAPINVSNKPAKKDTASAPSTTSAHDGKNRSSDNNRDAVPTSNESNHPTGSSKKKFNTSSGGVTSQKEESTLVRSKVEGARTSKSHPIFSSDRSVLSQITTRSGKNQKTAQVKAATTGKTEKGTKPASSETVKEKKADAEKPEESTAEESKAKEVKEVDEEKTENPVLSTRSVDFCQPSNVNSGSPDNNPHVVPTSNESRSPTGSSEKEAPGDVNPQKEKLTLVNNKDKVPSTSDPLPLSTNDKGVLSQNTTRPVKSHQTAQVEAATTNKTEERNKESPETVQSGRTDAEKPEKSSAESKAQKVGKVDRQQSETSILSARSLDIGQPADVNNDLYDDHQSFPTSDESDHPTGSSDKGLDNASASVTSHKEEWPVLENNAEEASNTESLPTPTNGKGVPSQKTTRSVNSRETAQIKIVKAGKTEIRIKPDSSETVRARNEYAEEPGHSYADKLKTKQVDKVDREKKETPILSVRSLNHSQPASTNSGVSNCNRKSFPTSDKSDHPTQSRDKELKNASGKVTSHKEEWTIVTSKAGVTKEKIVEMMHRKKPPIPCARPLILCKPDEKEAKNVDVKGVEAKHVDTNAQEDCEGDESKENNMTELPKLSKSQKRNLRNKKQKEDKTRIDTELDEILKKVREIDDKKMASELQVFNRSFKHYINMYCEHRYRYLALRCNGYGQLTGIQVEIAQFYWNRCAFQASVFVKNADVVAHFAAKKEEFFGTNARLRALIVCLLHYAIDVPIIQQDLFWLYSLKDSQNYTTKMEELYKFILCSPFQQLETSETITGELLSKYLEAPADDLVGIAEYLEKSIHLRFMFGDPSDYQGNLTKFEEKMTADFIECKSIDMKWSQDKAAIYVNELNGKTEKQFYFPVLPLRSDIFDYDLSKFSQLFPNPTIEEIVSFSFMISSEESSYLEELNVEFE